MPDQNREMDARNILPDMLTLAKQIPEALPDRSREKNF